MGSGNSRAPHAQSQTPAARTPASVATVDDSADREAASAEFAKRMAALAGGAQPAQQQPVQPAQQEQPKGEQSPAVRNTDPAETRYERARRAMLRSGFKEDEFRKLDRQEAIRRGLKLERQQNRQAAAHAAAQEANQRKGQGSPPAAAASASSNAPAPAQNGLAELLDKLGLKDDAEAQALLEKHLSPVLSENARLKAEIEQKAAGEQPDANQVKRVEAARQELAKSLGADLQDDDDWREVLLMADRISDHPKYRDALTDDTALSALLSDAARISLEIEVGERHAAAMLQGAARNGLVETSGQRATTPVAGRSVQDVGAELFAQRMQQLVTGAA